MLITSHSLRAEQPDRSVSHAGGNPSPCVRSKTEVLPDATRVRLVARTSESEANPNSFFVQRKTEVPGSGKIVVTGITTTRSICRDGNATADTRRRGGTHRETLYKSGYLGVCSPRLRDHASAFPLLKPSPLIGRTR